MVDNGGAHGPEERTGAIHLARGLHRVYIDYNQQGGLFQFDWLWARNGGALAPVPAWALVTRHVGLARFAASVALRVAALASQWTAVLALVLAAGRRAADRLAPLWRRLMTEGTWPALRWVLAGSLVLNAAGVWWGLPGQWVTIELVPRTVLDGLARHFSHGWSDAHPPVHYLLDRRRALAAARLGWRASHRKRGWRDAAAPDVPIRSA